MQVSMKTGIEMKWIKVFKKISTVPNVPLKFMHITQIIYFINFLKDSLNDDKNATPKI